MNILLKAISFLTIATCCSSNASATYNANMSGKVTDLAIYADGDFIYFILDNQPTSHPACNSGFFVIEETVPASRMDRLFARLLTAKTTGENVNIGYDATTECVHGYIKVHRVG